MHFLLLAANKKASSRFATYVGDTKNNHCKSISIAPNSDRLQILKYSFLDSL